MSVNTDEKKNVWRKLGHLMLGKKKIEKKAEQVWENISISDNEVNTDEIYFMKLLARNIAQHEDLYDWIKRKYGIGIIISIIFGVFGAIIAVLILLFSGGKTTISFSFLKINSPLLDAKLAILLSVAAILFEVLAGIGIWLYWRSLKQLWQYHEELKDSEQFLLMIGMAAKTKGLGKSADKELYARIVESELKRKEQLAFQKKDEKIYK